MTDFFRTQVLAVLRTKGYIPGKSNTGLAAEIHALEAGASLGHNGRPKLKSKSSPGDLNAVLKSSLEALTGLLDHIFSFNMPNEPLKSALFWSSYV